MTLATVAANGLALEDLGIRVLNLDEFLSAPQVTFPSVSIIDRMGQDDSVRGVVYSPKMLQLGIKADGGAIVTSRTMLGAWYMFAQGKLELEIVDAPGRVMYGILQKSTGSVFGVTLDVSGTNYETAGEILCSTPFWFDRVPHSIGGTAGQRVVVPCGSAPGRIRVYLAGPYTTPTFTLRDRSGNILYTLPLTDTAADGTIYLDLDFHNQYADRYVNSVRSALNNAYGLFDPNHTFFGVDPLDGATLECSSGEWEALVWRGYLV